MQHILLTAGDHTRQFMFELFDHENYVWFEPGYGNRLCTFSFPIQIWALAVSPETEKLATGGGDSVVNMWTDCTVDDEEEAIRQEVKIWTVVASVLVSKWCRRLCHCQFSASLFNSTFTCLQICFILNPLYSVQLTFANLQFNILLSSKGSFSCISCQILGSYSLFT